MAFTILLHLEHCSIDCLKVSCPKKGKSIKLPNSFLEVPDVAKNIPSRTLQQNTVITVTPKDSNPGTKPTGPVEDWTKENVSKKGSNPRIENWALEWNIFGFLNVLIC